jgi:hypothetical protein
MKLGSPAWDIAVAKLCGFAATYLERSPLSNFYNSRARDKVWLCQNWLCIARSGLGDADRCGPKRQCVTRLFSSISLVVCGTGQDQGRHTHDSKQSHMRIPVRTRIHGFSMWKSGRWGITQGRPGLELWRPELTSTGGLRIRGATRVAFVRREGSCIWPASQANKERSKL